MDDIQRAQVKAAENAVVERLRQKGLLPPDSRDHLPFTKDEHHELCLGVMARCYPYVSDDLKQAIREGIESAAQLGIPVSTKNLERGGPLVTGGNA